MDQAFTIIQMLQQQVPLEDIEKEVQWDKLTQADYENLFTEADLLRGAKSGFDLLGLMYKAVKDRDFWMETRILAAVILRPETEIERGKLLNRMRYCLELIRTSLVKVSRSDPQQLRYRRYLCDYVFLSARLLEDAGDLDRALKEYMAAQKAYTEYKFLDAAKEIDEPIGRLQRLKRQGDELVTFQTLTDRRSQIEKEISDLNTLYQEKQHQLVAVGSEIKLKETESMDMDKRIQDLNQSLAISQREIQNLRDETMDLENRKENSQAWLEQIEQEKTALVEQVITLREQSQALDVRVSQTALKLNDRLAALQAQIDLKNSELEKNSGSIGQKTSALNELDKLIEQRRHELALIEEQIHNDETYLLELSKKRSADDAESDLTPPIVEETLHDETAATPQEELAIKLERYKKSLKASRTRKKSSPNQESSKS
jgi:chromosome segregation ATPase